MTSLLLLLKSSEDVMIHRVAAGVITNLAMNKTNQELIMDQRGISLLSMTATDADDPQTLRMVARAIANLCGNGINMDLDFNLLEIESLVLSILVMTFTLQDGTSHFLKGLVLLCCYVIIGACFFILKAPLVPDTNILNSGVCIVWRSLSSLRGSPNQKQLINLCTIPQMQVCIGHSFIRTFTLVLLMDDSVVIQ
ncbi:hypothetical protein IFM89_036434 [Coptis chinensis]|uniref:Vacuolar protein 8 n=1 Tax=Coptis chinensis TaxID=261450 RepID=A0A835IKS7_9MAGN|nr:hypothetical protein IFM89_036434 [Coptis chinensis]